MNDTEFRQTLAKMRSLVATKNAIVMANPLKYLNEMNDRCSVLLRVLDDVEYALSPDIVFDTAKDMGIEPLDFNGGAELRCNKALEVLRKYKQS